MKTQDGGQVVIVRNPGEIDTRKLAQFPDMIICNDNTFRRQIRSDAESIEKQLVEKRKAQFPTDEVLYHVDGSEAYQGLKSINFSWDHQDNKFVCEKMRAIYGDGRVITWIPEAERLRERYRLVYLCRNIIMTLTYISIVITILSLARLISFGYTSALQTSMWLEGLLMISFVFEQGFFHSFERIYQERKESIPFR